MSGSRGEANFLWTCKGCKGVTRSPSLPRIKTGCSSNTRNKLLPQSRWDRCRTRRATRPKNRRSSKLTVEASNWSHLSQR